MVGRHSPAAPSLRLDDLLQPPAAPVRRRWPLPVAVAVVVLLVFAAVAAYTSRAPAGPKLLAEPVSRSGRTVNPLAGSVGPPSGTSQPRGESPAGPAASPAAHSVSAAGTGTGVGAVPPEAKSPPVRLRIPSIGVDTTLQALGLLSNGTLQSPTEWQRAGWYSRGVRPGSTGPAVIAGHVDSVSGPAVFFRLHELVVGAKVEVTRGDGSIVRFVVSSVRSYPKNAFPTQAVYGPTALPELRLITCTGDFDYKARSYLDNLVVTADLQN
ncbi:MAG: Peptidase sortase [Frankiales bacterium]|nr:Peptidase sortase [Frankiales bacterium]